MRCKICCIIFFFIIHFLSAQKQIDSLKLLLKQAKTDTAKLRLYTQLSENCEYQDIPLYSEPAISLTEKILKANNSNSLQVNGTENDFSKSKLPSKQKKAVLKY